MKEVLAKIKPSFKEQQKFGKATRSFLQKLNFQLAKAGLGAQAILGGSGAKGTWLAGNHDVDIFVLHDYSGYASRSAELSSLLQPILKKAFFQQKISRLHGSRDYFQVIFQGVNFEVIPILKISRAEQAVNITDASPLHARWVNQHTLKLKDDILLAKQFCQASGYYGAESYINGFSGYALEILIAYYGSFVNSLKASQNWTVREIIDIEKHYPSNDVLFQMNQSKLQSPLIIIDPVDKTRNAAAALSLDKFMLFKRTAKEYLRKPSADLFQKKERDFPTLKKEAEKRGNLIYIAVAPVAGKEDVSGVKLLRAFEFLQQGLQPFVLKDSGWEWDRRKKSFFYFITEKKELPKWEIRPGPPLSLGKHVKAFQKKNKDTFVRDGRILARVPAAFPRLDLLVKNLLKQKYFKEKVGKIKEVKTI